MLRLLQQTYNETERGVEMTVYVVEEITYDDTLRHGIFLSEESAKKKLKVLFNQKKTGLLYYTPEWINCESFGLYDDDSFEYGRVEINAVHAEP